MKILLTGAFGNIGGSTLIELLQQNHAVTCFDLPTKSNHRTARQVSRHHKFDIYWGDIRDSEAVAAAMQDHEVVIHLAFMIPPHADRKPELAREVNIEGTKNIIAAAITYNCRLIFGSSIAIFGHTQHLNPPRTIDDPVEATDLYTSHKILCEQMVQESGLAWCITRFTAVQPLNLSNIDPLMFEVPYNQRIEFAHSRDVGLALANAASSEDIWCKVLLIGGGKQCQMLYEEYIGQIFDAIGLARLPEAAFSRQPFHTDWLDTTESQHLLQYQRHTFDALTHEVAASLGYKRLLIRLFRPLIKQWFLWQSPYYRD